MHRLPLILTFFFLIINWSFAQQGNVSGKVVDHEQHLPVEFATVSLHRRDDSTFITGGVTDVLGKFSIPITKDGLYFISYKFLGYATLTTPAVLLNTKNNFDVGEIQLISDSKMLNEVVVNSAAATNLHKIDKQIYKASQFQSSQGGTAMDVLKNTPSVNVNAEGDISLRGASGFLVLINGKPVQSDYKSLLNQLPANTIENIEIITAPSAKYDPDGKGGIVNIVTKQGKGDGISFSANAQGGLPSIYNYGNLKNPVRYGADAILNIKSGKWDINVSGNYLRNDIAGRRVGDVNTTIGNRYTSFPSDGERSFVRKNYTGRASVNYSFNKNNSITAGVYKGVRYQSRRADIFYHNSKRNTTTDQIISSIDYFNSNVVEKTNDITLGNLDFVHTFSNKSALSLTGLLEHANSFGETRNENFNSTERSQLIQYTINPSKNPLNAYRVKADYSLPIDSGVLDIGYQYRNQLQKGDFQYLEKNLQTGNLIINPEFSSTTKVTNQIHSFYSQFTNKFKKFDYLVGLRYEYATRVFIAGDQPPKNLILSNLFPSANFQYRINQTLKTKAGYSKRVQRSTNNELNPFPEREHSETLERGDPNILPEFIDLAEVGVIKDFKMGNLFATLYYQGINNVVNRVNSVYNDSILNRIFTNAGRAKLWGIEAGTTLKPAKAWTVYFGGNIYDYSIKGALFNNEIAVNTSSVVFSINANTSVKLSKTTTFQWNLNYLSSKVTAQGKDSRFVTPNASFKKVFLSGKLSATLQWQNIDLGLLGTNKQRITTWGKDFYTTTNYIQETDIFLIQLGYNFNQIPKKNRLPTSEFGEKEF